MGQIEACYHQPSRLLSYVLIDWNAVLDDLIISDPEKPKVITMKRYVQVAYAATVRVERNCEAAIKDMRMGCERSEDKHIRRYDKELDILVHELLERGEQEHREREREMAHIGGNPGEPYRYDHESEGLLLPQSYSRV